jgi:hypothetical protein
LTHRELAAAMRRALARQPYAFGFFRKDRSMRALIALALLSVFGTTTPAAAADDYGEALCKKHVGGSAPCGCIGPVLEEEYDEEELGPMLLFMKTFMEGLASNSRESEQKAQKVIDQIEAEHGKETIEDWMKRYDGVEKELESSCKWKW